MQCHVTANDDDWGCDDVSKEARGARQGTAGQEESEHVEGKAMSRSTVAPVCRVEGHVTGAEVKPGGAERGVGDVDGESPHDLVTCSRWSMLSLCVVCRPGAGKWRRNVCACPAAGNLAAVCQSRNIHITQTSDVDDGVGDVDERSPHDLDECVACRRQTAREHRAHSTDTQACAARAHKPRWLRT